MFEKYLSISEIKAVLRDHLTKDEAFKVIQLIETVSPANVVPEVHGHWVDMSNFSYCSECEAVPSDISPFCPWCGAKMDADIVKQQ